MKYLVYMGFTLAVMAVLGFSACSSDTGNNDVSFLQIGEFTVNRISPERTEVRDGAGRTLVLIPREATAPKDVSPSNIIRVPVRRVAAYGYFDVATLKVLGVLEETLVGLTHPASDWHIPEVSKGFADHRIAYLGDSSSIDFERLKKQEPELVLTWDPSIIPMLDDLNIACVITTALLVTNKPPR